jgi:hypothetical protein
MLLNSSDPMSRQKGLNGLLSKRNLMPTNWFSLMKPG